MMLISISVKSLALSSASPLPPSIRSIIAYPSPLVNSMMIEPGIGEKLTTVSNTGLDRALENSAKVTVSELATLTCTFFLRYTGRFVDNSLP